MRKSLLMLAGLAVSGCEAPPPTSPEVSITTPIDFAGWPSATPKPVRVELRFGSLCNTTHEEIEEQEAESRRRHGPHSQLAILIRVSPEAMSAFRAHTPLPVGSVVIKEKHEEKYSKGPPNEYAAMIKREAGYDPANGDWEYLYETRKPNPGVTRGRLTDCIECHRRAAATDYLFRQYEDHDETLRKHLEEARNRKVP
jgi:hypothetical protein